jgi:hypothetical protein
MSWTVSFEAPDPGHPLAGNELLTFCSRQLQARESDFHVEIHNMPTEVWDVVKKLALFVTPPKAGEIIKTKAGTLLLNEEYKGRVYVRGLFVRTFEDLQCGYDLQSVQLDRDRQMIDEWQLHWQLGELWASACGKDHSLEERVYEMSKKGSPEVRNLKHHADAALIERVKEQFQQEHGENAVPVATSSEAKEVTRIGGKPAVVSSMLKELLEPAGLSVEAARKKLDGAVVKRWSPTDLDEAANAISCRLEGVIPNMIVVTFAGETPACLLIDDKKVVGVDRRMLDKPFKDVLSAALIAEGERVGKAPLDLLLEHVAGKEPEPPADNGDADECDECHHQIPVTERSTVNAWHASSCSLYHPDDAPPEVPA